MLHKADSSQINNNSSNPAQDIVVTLAASKAKDGANLYMHIYILTAVFGAIFVVVPWFLPKGPNRGLFKWCIMLTSFSMWLFWVTVYIAQMNPLLGPRIENDTLAWIIHSRKSLSPTPISPLPTPSENIEKEPDEIEALKMNKEEKRGMNMTLKSKDNINVQQLVRFYNKNSSSKVCLDITTGSVINNSDYNNYEATKAVTRTMLK